MLLVHVQKEEKSQKGRPFLIRMMRKLQKELFQTMRELKKKTCRN